jgi:transcription elongation factor GreA
MITKLGKEKLKQDLETLQNELKDVMVERGKAGREGDLKENSAYIFFGEKAEMIRSQISEASEDLRSAVVQEAPKDTDNIKFGHRVTVRYENDQRELTITLVGKNDTKLKPNWICFESPIGQALMGKKVGDKAIVNEQTITILNIQIGDI